MRPEWVERTSALLRSLLLLVLTAQLAACAVNPGREDPEEALLLDGLTRNVEVPTPGEQILGLPEAVRLELDQVVADDWSQLRKFRALRHFLFDENKRNIRYDAKATRTAAQTFESGSGNCLSISNLFVASARHLGMDAFFKTVSVLPTWEQTGTTLIRYEHIVAIGKLANRDEYIVDLLPELRTTSMEGKVVSDNQALALYYSNLFAEAVVVGELEEATELILKSIKLWPEHSDSWNNIGAVYRRLGDDRMSELSYKRALRLDGNNYSALSNLTRLYLAEDREAEAEQFLSRVKRYYRKNPYYYYYLARLSYSVAEYEEARRFLHRAIRLKRDDAELYRALSDTYARLGNDEKAEQLAALAATVKPRKARYRGERNPWGRSISISP